MNFTSIAQRAKQAAGSLLEQFPLRDGYSVDIEALAEKLDIRIIEGELRRDGDKQTISGLLKINGKEGRPIIAIKADEPPNRKRFTIAHEIGHFLLHKDELLHIDSDLEAIAFRDSSSSLAIDRKEIEANQFAAELLMPSDEIRESVRTLLAEGKEITNVIQIISRRYKVSATAATIKIGSLANS